MTVKEFTAKTTEDAISDGLRSFNCSISDVRVEVLEEGSKGLFGLFGSRPAKVRMTLLSDSDDDKANMSALLSTLTLDPQVQQRQRKVQRAPKPVAQKVEPKVDAVPQAAPQDAPAPKAQAPEKAKPLAPKAPAARPAARPVQKRAPREENKRREPFAPAAPAMPELPTEPPVIQDPATPAGQAQQFLMEVTTRMNVPVAVYADTLEDGNVYIRMTGDTLGILIGRRGETLDALQYLTSLQVNKGRDEYIRVTLDTENYRAKREDSLRRLATRMATKAIKTGRKVSLEPMNPYERRVLHASLQNHTGVTTHSEGEEPNRHVVITLKGAGGERQAQGTDGKPAPRSGNRPPRKRAPRPRKPVSDKPQTQEAPAVAVAETPVVAPPVAATPAAPVAEVAEVGAE